ncbi:hypothetical protein [Streptomyces sp. NBC_01262]|uniref:hypothetical protein n=1 Tax=Streptomyces sp. NBC_01262 TaxID=2903803 RepID=UPI002E379E8F|nr:hypothetical protein [Streptomyces sp. NBC_01262]
MKDAYSNITLRETLSIATRTASANGTGVDRNTSGMMCQDAMIVVHTGTITDGTHTVEVQDSDDNTTFAAVADAYLQGTEPAIVAADDNKLFIIGYKGPKRYLRVAVTAAGTTTGGVYGATVVLADPRVAPVVHG